MADTNAPPPKLDVFYNFVTSRAQRNDVGSILKAYDEFARTQRFLMNVGDEKGPIVEEVIAEHKPRVVVELGCFLGYSAMRFASKLAEGSRYFSFEVNPEFAALSKRMFAHAGLSDRVTIIEGAFDQRHAALRHEHGVDTVDMFFIDHAKELYLPDFKIILSQHYLKPGSVVVADNIITPGAPDYLAFVQNDSRFTTKVVKTHLEYSDQRTEDAVAISVFRG